MLSTSQDRHGPGAVQTAGPRNASAVSEVAASLQAGATRVNPKDGLTYVWIPPGKFMMGCSPGDNECEDLEKPAYEVTLTKGFWTGQTEVTQEAYQRVTGSNPSAFTGGKLPVENVSWIEADEYCRAISGRLPTEAEWEYAARAGDRRSRYGAIASIAWYGGNSGSKTHAVALKTTNSYGLYDVLGNVQEWVADWSADSYPTGAATDPRGPSGGHEKVVRGGSWYHDSGDARVSHRLDFSPEFRSDKIGFRCAAD